MFKIKEKIQFSKESNRMQSIANTKVAREMYYSNKYNNVKFLLSKRFGWMNKFIKESDHGIEVGSGAGFSKDFIKNKNFKLTDLGNDEHLDYKNVDAQNTGFKTGDLDFVIASNMIHHIPYPIKFFKEIKKKIKKIKKKNKTIDLDKQANIIKNLDFILTNDQYKSLKQINDDLSSSTKMFRLLQGDVGSGKTIVSLLSAFNTINSGFQVAVMAPTEILARQHFLLAQKIYPKNINIELISGKSDLKTKKNIHEKLLSDKIDILFGTHALFQKKITFKKLGLIIIDEQHKFGVNQRKKLSDKGGHNCDVLLMTATPIPRTLTMTIYGDMDLSIIREKPKSRKPIKTYSKLENKIDDVIKFIKKEIKLGHQIFWVCPLIEESKK